ncbi:MAG: tripartite tricarboxylate transporter substrate binding protein, partial [Paracoccus sp. (in: a-proteobacteria)]|nr:tripartite tricarboxylate transporter substrate binding protein [Paracoccus sp. (in: a-proteobacteria)]
KGMPEDVRTTVVSALAAAMADPGFVQKMDEMGEFVDYRDPAGFETLAREDSARAEGIIRDLGMYGMNQ